MSTPELSELWQDFFRTRSQETQKKLIEHYIEEQLVNRIVRKIMINQLPDGMEREDLIQFGVCGLIQALQNYNPDKGAKFETFATSRIQGAIRDEIRYYIQASGGMNRTSRKKMKTIEVAIRKLEQQFMRTPTPEEIAFEMGIESDEYYKMLGEIGTFLQLSLDAGVGDDEEKKSPIFVIRNEESPIPEEDFFKEEQKKRLQEALNQLPINEQKVIHYHYDKGYKAKEISKIMELTEPRISQLHSSAMIHLRTKLMGGD